MMASECKTFLLIMWLLLAGLMITAIHVHEQSHSDKPLSIADPGLVVLGAAFATSTMLVFAAGIIFLST
jgi:hypothetical protein